MIEAGTEIAISLKIKLPTAATEDQINEWLRFQLNDNGSMSVSNPLVHKTIEPVFPFGLDWSAT